MSAITSPATKPTLYVYDFAVWASAPWLALYALGYKDKIDVKQINLLVGDNYSPDFLKLNPLGTLPIIDFGDKVIVESDATVTYLIENAPKVGKPSGTDFVKKIHNPLIDGNMALLSALSDEELAEKGSGFGGTIIRNREDALKKFSATAPPEFADFYVEKKKFNGFFASLYDGTASKEVKELYYVQSAERWATIRSFILNDIPAVLPESGFIGGDIPGEDDFHLAGWMGRQGLLAGGTPAADGALAFKETHLKGAEVPPKLVNYWKLWSETEAWKTVYANGLH